jgi:SAM-dependent methyltransferase
MAISYDAVLARAPELVVELDSANEVRVHHCGAVWTFGHHALALLEAFHQPQSIGEAFQRLKPRLAGERAIREVVTTLEQMVSSGVLAPEAKPGFTELMFPRGNYGLAYAHIRMLDDPMRKNLFLQAVRETVRPGDVVLDLGTGSGILAVAAAQAGAKRVYAVEPSRTVGVAKALAEHNGVAEKITFIQDWSSTLTLPEKANVLTTDIVGNDALDMVIWETLQDARRRLLTPDARLVPSSLRAYVYLAEIPAENVAAHRIVPRHIEEWNARYDMDFAPLLEIDRERVAGFYEPPSTVAGWEQLSEPVALYDVDLAQDARTFRGDVTAIASGDGLVTGAIVYFEAYLSPEVTLCTAPANGDPRSHWFNAGWVFDQPVKVTTGDKIALSYHYEGDGRAWLQLTENS